MENNNMRVFKFHDSQYHYGICAKSQEEAEAEYRDTVGDHYDKVEEVPQSEWDTPFITIYEDDDREKDTFQMSIREAMVEGEAVLIFTNDSSIVD